MASTALEENLGIAVVNSPLPTGEVLLVKRGHTASIKVGRFTQKEGLELAMTINIDGALVTVYGKWTYLTRIFKRYCDGIPYSTLLKGE